MSAETMDLLDALLMRVLDGEATDAERQQLLGLADAEPRLAEMQSLRARLRAALTERAADAPEVVGEVMMALSLDDGWDATADLLRSELEGEAIDVVGGVMDALEVGQEQAVRVSALHDGELSVEERLELAGQLDRTSITQMTEWANMGRLLRQELQEEVKQVDITNLWAQVAPAIGVENPEEVPGWEPLADALREAVAEQATLSATEEIALTAAVMNALPRDEEVVEEVTEESVVEEQPAWIRWTSSSPALVFVVAMLALVAVFYNGDSNGTDDPSASDERVAVIEAAPSEFEITASNEAEVEDLEVADEVTASVFQAEEGAPMFLMIDEGDEEEATL